MPLNWADIALQLAFCSFAESGGGVFVMRLRVPLGWADYGLFGGWLGGSWNFHFGIIGVGLRRVVVEGCLD